LRTELRIPRLTGKLVGGVRLEMLGRGFTLVKTPRFFDEGLYLRLERGTTVLPFDSKRWDRLPQLARYVCWLEELLERALPEESLSLTALEVRQEPAGSEDQETDRWHADGSYLRSVYSLYGPTTVYHDGDERSVPEGQTLLMTAQNRARALGVPCTLHRRPGPGPERAVIVGTFEPYREPALPVEVYRRAAQTPGARRHHSEQ
jgi:hypothetical protein